MNIYEPNLNCAFYFKKNLSKYFHGRDNNIHEAFWLWGYQIAYDEYQKVPTTAQLVNIYNKLIPIWNDVASAMDTYFDKPDFFYNTRAHYDLLIKGYQEQAISTSLRLMRSHRHEYLTKNPNASAVDYASVVNNATNLSLPNDNILLQKHDINNIHIKKALHKKWHNGQSNLKLSTYNALDNLGLLDCVQSFQDLNDMFYWFENIYFSDENMDDFLINYFFPRDNICYLLGRNGKPFIPRGFLDFVKQQKDKLTWGQYRSLLECAMVFPDKINFTNLKNPGAYADAFIYAYNCWQDDINCIIQSKELREEQKQYRLNCLKTDDLASYLDLYYTCRTEPYSLQWLGDYIRRLVNWADDNIRWCMNHPYKAYTLLLLSAALTAIFSIFTPVVAAVSVMATKFNWTAPAWISAIGTAGTLISAKMASVPILKLFAGAGRTHLFIHIANNKIQGSIKNTVMKLDFDKISSDLSGKFAKYNR